MTKTFKRCVLFLFLSLPLYSQEKGAIEGFASLWFLAEGESIATPLKIDIPVLIEIPFSQSPGFVSVRKSSFSFEGEMKIQAELSIFNICEHNDIGCLKTYFLAQVKLSGDTQSFCGSYFGKEDFFPMPVFFCSAYYKKGFLGITFHRKRFRE